MLQKINFNNFSLSDISDGSSLLKALWVIFSCCLLAITLYELDISPELQKLYSQQAKEQVLRENFIALQRQAVKFDAHQKQLEKVKQLLSSMVLQLTPRQEIPSLLEAIAKMAASNGVIIKLIKPLPEIRQEFFIELPIQISACGSYHQLLEFFNQIVTCKKIIHLQDFFITTVSQDINSVTKLDIEPNRLQVDMVAKIYLALL